MKASELSLYSFMVPLSFQIWNVRNLQVATGVIYMTLTLLRVRLADLQSGQVDSLSAPRSVSQQQPQQQQQQQQQQQAQQPSQLVGTVAQSNLVPSALASAALPGVATAAVTLGGEQAAQTPDRREEHKRTTLSASASVAPKWDSDILAVLSVLRNFFNTFIP